jgi:hypothetical protein
MTKISVLLSGAFVLACLGSCDRPSSPPSSQPDGPEPQSQGLVIPSRTPPPLFTDVDKDSDGYINRDEANNTSMSFVFTDIDANQDETLSRLEYDQYCQENSQSKGCSIANGDPNLVEGMKEQFRHNSGDPLSDPRFLTKIASDFDSLDNNEDDYISREESNDDNVYAHFGEIDTNNDNRLARWEFRAYLQQYGRRVAEDSVADKYFSEEQVDGDSLETSKGG